MKIWQDLLRDVLDTGTRKEDRTGTGTISAFVRHFRHDLASGFPLLTVKDTSFEKIFYELQWFLRGDTNIKWLNERGVHIWDAWADENGELGPIYGKQWTAWPTKDGGTINQIDRVVELLKNNPSSRRILFCGWNPEYLPDESLSPQQNVKNGKMALPPCHMTYQFYVIEGKLSAHLLLRSNDLFLGNPYNLASVSILTHMLAQQCNFEVGEVAMTMVDSHIYLNHLDQVELALSRDPRPLPSLKIKRKPASIYDYQLEDFELVGYDPHPAIRAAVAV